MDFAASGVVPVTVAGLESLSTPADQVLLIGVVECEVPGNIYLDFTLNDSTGRVGVRYLFPGHFWQLRELLGCYVRVVGRRVHTNTRYVLAHYVELVTEADAISCHTLAVVQAHLQRQQRQ